jgi:hypothetical protein
VNLPDESLIEKNEAELKKKLAETKAAMTEDEIAAIVASTNADSDDEDNSDQYIKELNVSSVENLREELDNYKPKEYDYTDETVDHVRELTAVADIGNIGFASMIFDVSSLTVEQLQYLALYNDIQMMLPSKNYSATELQTLLSGSTDFEMGLLASDDEVYYNVELRLLNEDMDNAYQYLYERLFNTDFSDTEIIKALVARQTAADVQDCLGNPNSAALSRVKAHMNEEQAVDEYTSGLAYLEFLNRVSGELEEDPESVVKKLSEAASVLYNKSNAAAVYAGNEDGIRRFKTASENFFKEVPYEERSAVKRDYDIAKSSEAFIIGGDVNFNTVGASPEDLGTELDGSIDVVSSLIYDTLLIPQLRFTKGAYDVLNASGEMGIYIQSYRDPQLKDTYEYYENVGSQLESLDLTYETLEGYIVSSFVSNASHRGVLLDTWHTLATMVYDPDQDQKAYERMKEMLDTTVEKVKAAAPVLDSLAENGAKCTVGKESDIIANADLFDTITIPFGDNEIYIYVNGKRVQGDTAPVIENDTVLVPFKPIAEALGSDVKAESDMVPLDELAETLNCSAEWKGGCVVIK